MSISKHLDLNLIQTQQNTTKFTNDTIIDLIGLMVYYCNINLNITQLGVNLSTN